jgi:hypothetical protein
MVSALHEKTLEQIEAINAGITGLFLSTGSVDDVIFGYIMLLCRAFLVVIEMK